jgi:hypothetical protein
VVLGSEISEFTLEQVSENGRISLKADGQIDFFGEGNLRAWVVPGERIATVVYSPSAYPSQHEGIMKDRRIRQLEQSLGRKSLEIEILKNVVGE